jgi:uncharacterized protein YabN with tetrapyrrole methylase and pyrophosphatase domain
MTDPLERARQLQLDAAAEGFDWSDMQGVWLKLAEELEELRAARSHASQRDELGDLLFMVVNLSRHLGLDAAQALEAASDKFARRFAYIRVHSGGLPPPGDRRRLEAMEGLWIEAKRLEGSVE